MRKPWNDIRKTEVFTGHGVARSILKTITMSSQASRSNFSKKKRVAVGGIAALLTAVLLSPLVARLIAFEIGANGGGVYIGTSGDDTLNGSNGNDLISGGEGSDKLLGGMGDDVLFGSQARYVYQKAQVLAIGQTPVALPGEAASASSSDEPGPRPVWGLNIAW